VPTIHLENYVKDLQKLNLISASKFVPRFLLYDCIVQYILAVVKPQFLCTTIVLFYMDFCLLKTLKIMPKSCSMVSSIQCIKLVVQPNKFVLYNPSLMLYGHVLNVDNSPWDVFQSSLLLLSFLSAQSFLESVLLHIPLNLSLKSAPHLLLTH
jgi:hypothetical protein